MIESILVVPFWSQSGGINWDSNYAYLRKILPIMADEHPNSVWTMLFPQQSKRKNWKWYDDNLFDHPRINRYPFPYASSMRQGVMTWDPERLKEIEYYIAPTIFWLHQVEMGVYLKGGYAQSFTPYQSLVAQHHYIIHPSLPYPIDTMFNRRWMQMGGSLASQKVVCNSQHTKTMMVEAFGEYLSNYQMEELDKKTEVLKFGLVENPPKPKKYNKPVILYNHRFENYKQPKVTAKVINELKKEKLDFEVWVSQYADQKLNLLPVDKIVGHPDYNIYMENIAYPAINTINSTHETFCISILDSMSVGHIIVAPKGVTFVELLPEDYPYLFKNEKEQFNMIKEIINNFTEIYEKWSIKLIERAKKEFGLIPYCKKYNKLLNENSPKLKSCKPKEKTKKGLDLVAESLNKPIAIYDLVREIHKKTGTASQAMSSARVVTEMTMRGMKMDIRMVKQKPTLVIKP